MMRETKKSILVIGGSGFIGSRLIERLLEAGYTVKNYDKNQSSVYPDLTFIGDVRDIDSLEKQAKGMDIIYNLAAEHRDNVRPHSLYYEVNVKGAKNVVYVAEKNDIKTIIFTSTVALYGLNKGIPSEDSTIEPFNGYGKSKYQAEEIFKNWANKRNERTLVIIRPVVIFGERNRGNVYNLMQQIAKGKFVMVGSGKNKKSMGYVENIAQFLVDVANLPSGQHIFNYADKPDLTVNELVEIIHKELGKSFKFRLPYLIGLFGGIFMDIISKITGKTFPISSIRVKKFCASTEVSTEKLEEFNFTPPYSLKEALKRTIRYEFPEYFS
jgi:nucleoside-diphosphate-sugar epimerase